MSEKKKRKIHTPEFRAKVELVALMGVKASEGLSLVRQCELAGVTRSTVYASR